MPHAAQYVYFNDGENENVYALVIKDNGGGNLNLATLPESGQPSVENGVPRREPSDYGEEGGGRTWHDSHTAAAVEAPAEEAPAEEAPAE